MPIPREEVKWNMKASAFAKKTALAYQHGCRNKLLGPGFCFSYSHYQPKASFNLPLANAFT